MKKNKTLKCKNCGNPFLEKICDTIGYPNKDKRLICNLCGTIVGGKKVKQPLRIAEKDFKRQIVELACIFHWKVYQVWLSIHSPAGFPDLTLCRENKDGTASLIMAELKSERGRPSKAQEEWLTILGKVPNIKVFVWYPHDFEAIANILR